jgi:hypothetical protein
MQGDQHKKDQVNLLNGAGKDRLIETDEPIH